MPLGQQHNATCCGRHIICYSLIVGSRNEIGLLNEPDIFAAGMREGLEHWVGMSMYIPADYKPDRLKTINIQIKVR